MMSVLYTLLCLIFIIIYSLLTVHTGFLDEYYILTVSYQVVITFLNSNCDPWDGIVKDRFKVL